jgi:hypothetical protein
MGQIKKEQEKQKRQEGQEEKVKERFQEEARVRK